MTPAAGADDEAPLLPASKMRVLRMNSPEWHFILLGLIAAFVMGGSLPAYAVLLGDVIGILVRKLAKVVCLFVCITVEICRTIVQDKNVHVWD